MDLREWEIGLAVASRAERRDRDHEQCENLTEAATSYMAENFMLVDINGDGMWDWTEWWCQWHALTTHI